MPLRRRTEGLLVHDTEGEVLVLDEAEGRIHQLNATAAVIWRMSERGDREICRALLETYELEEASAIEDVRRTLAELTLLGLVEEV